MHRVLSYQTAMQINEDRDIRAYITKRTCISVIFSASFFTLIMGFLLGKFVTDRQYKIRQMTQPEYVTILKEIQMLRRSIETASLNVTASSLHHTQVEYNRQLWHEVVACTERGQAARPRVDISFIDFVNGLMDNELNIVLTCFARWENKISTIQRDGKD